MSSLCNQNQSEYSLDIEEVQSQEGKMVTEPEHQKVQLNLNGEYLNIANQFQLLKRKWKQLQFHLQSLYKVQCKEKKAEIMFQSMIRKVLQNQNMMPEESSCSFNQLIDQVREKNKEKIQFPKVPTLLEYTDHPKQLQSSDHYTIQFIIQDRSKSLQQSLVFTKSENSLNEEDKALHENNSEKFNRMKEDLKRRKSCENPFTPKVIHTSETAQTLKKQSKFLDNLVGKSISSTKCFGVKLQQVFDDYALVLMGKDNEAKYICYSEIQKIENNLENLNIQITTQADITYKVKFQFKSDADKLLEMIAVFEKRRNRKLSIQSKLEEIKAMSYKDNKMDRIKKKINEHYKN